MDHDLLTGRERGALYLRLSIRASLTAALILSLRLFALPLLRLLLPFALALAAAWLLNVPVRALQSRLTLPRKVISLWVVAAVLCILGGLLAGLLRIALQQVRSLLEHREAVAETLLEALRSVRAWLSRFQHRLPAPLSALGEEAERTLTRALEDIDLSLFLRRAAARAPLMLSGISGFAVAAVVFLTACFLITGDYPRLRLLFSRRFSTDTRAFCGKLRTICKSAFGGYLKSQLLLSLGVFLILAVGFPLIRQPYSLVLAFALAVLDFIPLLGAGTVMVPWMAVDLISGNPSHALRFALLWGLIVLFRRIAEPKILGDQTGLDPLLSLLGIYAGMRLGGAAGMILGPVVLLVCVNLVKLGIFRPLILDLRSAVRDLRAILRGGTP